jgi:hypothetical protein
MRMQSEGLLLLATIAALWGAEVSLMMQSHKYDPPSLQLTTLTLFIFGLLPSIHRVVTFVCMMNS